jgi:hypothetical protein
MPTNVLALKSTIGEGANEMQRLIILMRIISRNPA